MTKYKKMLLSDNIIIVRGGASSLTGCIKNKILTDKKSKKSSNTILELLFNSFKNSKNLGYIYFSQ